MYKAILNYIFKPKTKAMSSEVNDNFSVLTTAHNLLDDRVESINNALISLIGSTKDTLLAQISATNLSLAGLISQVNDIIVAIVDTASPNKVLKLNSQNKLPADITGDSATVGGFSPGNSAGNILKLDVNALISPNNLPKATASTIGAVRIGSGINIDENGIISAEAGNVLSVIDDNTATNDRSYSSAKTSYLIQAVSDFANNSISTINGLISSLDTRVGALEFDIPDIQTMLDSISTSLALKANASTTQAAIDIINDESLPLKADVTSVQNLQSQLDLINTNITSIQSSITELQTSTDTLQTGVNSLQSDVISVQSTLGTLQTNYAALQSDLNTEIANRATSEINIQSQIDALTARINALENPNP